MPVRTQRSPFGYYFGEAIAADGNQIIARFCNDAEINGSSAGEHASGTETTRSLL